MKREKFLSQRSGNDIYSSLKDAMDVVKFKKYTNEQVCYVVESENSIVLACKSFLTCLCSQFMSVL